MILNKIGDEKMISYTVTTAFLPKSLDIAYGLYYRFTLSCYRDIELMMAEHHVTVSHETIRY